MKIDLFGYSIKISKEIESDSKVPQEVKEALQVLKKYGIKTKSTKKQRISAKRATQARQDEAKQKIMDSINLLVLEGKNISEYAIAKDSGCSINTVKKYRDYIEKRKKEQE